MELKSKNFSIFEIFKITFPTIIMMSFMSLYTMVDGAFVSKAVNTNALSAVNIVYPFVNFILGISIMIGTGGCALVMKKVGEGKNNEARKDFSLLILFAIILSIILTIISIIFLKPIILFLGSTDILYNYCKDYLFFMILFITPTILKFIFEQFLIAINKSNLALFLSFLGGILNIILDYIFIVVLDFGIKGAALATGIGYAIPAFFGFFIFFSKKNFLYYEKPSTNLKIIFKSCSNGSSEMITQISNGVITYLFNIFMLKMLGEDGVAAITIVLYIQFLVTAVFIGYTIGISPKISYFYGCDDKQMLKKIIKNSLKIILMTSIIIYLLITFLSPFLISFFTEKNTNVFYITLNGLKIYSISFILIGFNIFMSGMFTSFSNGAVSATISFLRSLIFETFGIIIFSIIFGVIGLWSSVCVAEFFGILISGLFYFKFKNKYGY